MKNYFKLAEMYFREGDRSNPFINRLFELLEEIDYKCNADGRRFIAEKMSDMPLQPYTSVRRENWERVLEAAESVGGCFPGHTYAYENAQGGKSVARVNGLYELLPKDLVNPFVVGFSGVMTVIPYVLELLRFDAKHNNRLLPFLAIGKGGNKGLYEEVFNRENGLMVSTEYQAYLKTMELFAPSEYVREYETAFNDTDTAGNIQELYRFAKNQGLEEVTYILVSGQACYDKRLLAEWMLALKRPEFSEVKINLILVHCPRWRNGTTPEGHISEISLGYAAACLGPLMKDTISFDGKTTSEHPERYLMPDVTNVNWDMFKTLICECSNMGWPNYMEILYGIEHKLAVAFIMLSHLYALRSFTPEKYDKAILADMKNYIAFISKNFRGRKSAKFLPLSWKKWLFKQQLRKTTNEKFFV